MNWMSQPVSRVLSRTVIPLDLPLLAGSSHLPADSASNVIACLFGVAPDGGCRVSPFTTATAINRGDRKDSSLWPCSSPCGVRPLAVILLCGARTFLFWRMASSDCPINSPIFIIGLINGFQLANDKYGADAMTPCSPLGANNNRRTQNEETTIFHGS
jgi:hypothetical protein